MVSIPGRIFAETKGNTPSEIDVFFSFLGSGICTLKWVLQLCACFLVPQVSLILEPFCDPDTGPDPVPETGSTLCCQDHGKPRGGVEEIIEPKKGLQGKKLTLDFLF